MRKFPPTGIRSLDGAAHTSRYPGPPHAAPYVTCFARITGVFSSALSMKGAKEDKVYDSVKERRDWKRYKNKEEKYEKVYKCKEEEYEVRNKSEEMK